MYLYFTFGCEGCALWPVSVLASENSWVAFTSAYHQDVKFAVLAFKGCSLSSLMTPPSRSPLIQTGTSPEIHVHSCLVQDEVVALVRESSRREEALNLSRTGPASAAEHAQNVGTNLAASAAEEAAVLHAARASDNPIASTPTPAAGHSDATAPSSAAGRADAATPTSAAAKPDATALTSAIAEEAAGPAPDKDCDTVQPSAAETASRHPQATPAEASRGRALAPGDVHDVKGSTSAPEGVDRHPPSASSAQEAHAAPIQEVPASQPGGDPHADREAMLKQIESALRLDASDGPVASGGLGDGAAVCGSRGGGDARGMQQGTEAAPAAQPIDEGIQALQEISAMNPSGGRQAQDADMHASRMQSGVSPQKFLEVNASRGT